MFARLTKFSLRDLVLITAIVALVLALWLTAQKVPMTNRPGGFPTGGAQTTIEGPLLVSYRQRTSPNSTSGSDDVPLKALHFVEGGVVFEYKRGGFRHYNASRLESLSWKAE